MQIAVIGAGSWGTTLANLLAEKGIDTRLWVREDELLAVMQEHRENTWFLPEVTLDPRLDMTSDLTSVGQQADYVLMTVPCQFLRSVLSALRPGLGHAPVIVCCSKGIEVNSLQTMSEVVGSALDGLRPQYAVLSGPSFAREVSQGLPTAVTLGCTDRDLGANLQAAFSTETFRVYLSSDFKGVELAGALKNVMAIATGISDGLEFGSDARAALITRGLAEMSRLGVAMGARAETFMGLAGLGDLVLTCTGDLSRNRQVGLRLGRGESLQSILGGMHMVAEGVKTTEAVRALGHKLGVDMPITEEVFAMLTTGKKPRQSVHELMTRALKEE